jgi:hypothetical protein
MLNVALGVAAIVAALLVAAGVAAYQGWITIPFIEGFGRNTEPPRLEAIAKAVSGVDAGSFISTFHLAAQPLQEGTPVIDALPPPPPVEGEEEAFSGSAERLKSMASLIPSTFELSLETDTTYKKGEHMDVDNHYKGSFVSNGISLLFDARSRQLGDDVYLQVNTLPIPFIDVAAISGDWVHIETKHFMSNMISGVRPEARVWEPVEDASLSEKPDAPLSTDAAEEELRILREELFAHNAFVITGEERGPASDDPSRTVWKLKATLDPERVREAIVAAVARRPDGGEPTVLTDALKAYVDREVFVSWLQRLKEVVRVRFEADGKNILPLRQTLELRYTTAAQQAEQEPKEYVVSWEYLFKAIGEPVNIVAPADTIDVQKAFQRVMGRSDETVRFKEQAAVVDDVQTALTAYHEQNESYPEALSALVGFVAYSERVVRIPDDVFTQKPFPYTRSADGQGYTLVYDMMIPSDEVSSQSTYVQGTNTATEKEPSQEAAATKDSDQDGLTDAEEAQHSTSRYRADSDNDGFSDKDEITNGHNPLQHAETGKTVGPFQQ